MPEWLQEVCWTCRCNHWLVTVVMASDANCSLFDVLSQLSAQSIHSIPIFKINSPVLCVDPKPACLRRPAQASIARAVITPRAELSSVRSCSIPYHLGSFPRLCLRQSPQFNQKHPDQRRIHLFATIPTCTMSPSGIGKSFTIQNYPKYFDWNWRSQNTLDDLALEKEFIECVYPTYHNHDEITNIL